RCVTARESTLSRCALLGKVIGRRPAPVRRSSDEQARVQRSGELPPLRSEQHRVVSIYRPAARSETAHIGTVATPAYYLALCIASTKGRDLPTPTAEKRHATPERRIVSRSVPCNRDRAAGRVPAIEGAWRIAWGGRLICPCVGYIGCG